MVLKHLSATSDYYLFNPWTGETILTSTQNFSILDRSKSMWAKPDKFPSVNAKTTQVIKLQSETKLVKSGIIFLYIFVF